jgi:hypothetical protein
VTADDKQPKVPGQEPTGHGQKLTRKMEVLIGNLLTEPTYAEAARKTGISEPTLYRWLALPDFRKAYRDARRRIVEGAVGRLQAAAGTAVDTLLAVARDGKKDGDRVRAAVALLDHAFRGLADADALDGGRGAGDASPMGTADVVKVLAGRLRQVDQAELPTAEKARLTATLADALLRAIGVDVLDKRLEALQNVLTKRKEKERS